ARQKAAGASAINPATPSAMIAPYLKTPNKKRKAKPGRKAGHEGARRAEPDTIHRREEHWLDRCPVCGGPVHPCKKAEPRRRYVEDIQQTQAETTEHLLHPGYCPHCKKNVEPVITDALPHATIGNRTLALTSWLHYGLGTSVSQVANVLNSLFHFPVSDGGLCDMWRRLADILRPWHDQIAAQAKDSAVLNADETGWRVNGKTYWLWCFTSPTLTCYHIDPSRGSAVVNEFLGEMFKGTLVSDFFGAYNRVATDKRQVCLAHLLREIKKVSKDDFRAEWTAFAKHLKRLVKDALRLDARTDYDAPDFVRKRTRLYKRLDGMIANGSKNPNAKRLVKRLKRYREALLRFLHDPAVPPDNNRTKREIRPAVISGKSSFHNTSNHGAQAQAALMSVYCTLKLRGHDPIETIRDALACHIGGGKLPPLPKLAASRLPYAPSEHSD
ncbi:MAG: IS66 family transposase, partial [bacterium]|nr:IS66 family transposase [bacterium]